MILSALLAAVPSLSDISFWIKNTDQYLISLED